MFALFALAHAEDLYVSSNERGAAILLNGVDTGYTTPATIPGVKPGQALVTVEGGCTRGEAVVDVLKGLTTRVSIVATEQLGTLTVVPVPATARLELDSASFQGVPGLPLAVSCGDHTVRASLDGHVPAIVTVTVGMGQDLTVPINLQKLGIGTLELSVTPRNATIYVDGKPVGSDAVTLPSVYQGVHTISAELDGYQSAK
ncbi:MAG: PEGA domain-containing protein, partial [Myxococcota bacterium]